jgi:hypothetical protein
MSVYHNNIQNSNLIEVLQLQGQICKFVLCKYCDFFQKIVFLLHEVKGSFIGCRHFTDILRADVVFLQELIMSDEAHSGLCGEPCK